MGDYYEKRKYRGFIIEVLGRTDGRYSACWEWPVNDGLYGFKTFYRRTSAAAIRRAERSIDLHYAKHVRKLMT